MLLSHSHKFIFIHIYKTGGMSVKKALQRYDQSYSLLLHLKSFLKKKPVVEASIAHKHAKASDISKLIDKNVFDNYHKFAVVRNPFDWQVSLYHYILRMPPDVHPHYKIIQNLKGFDEYVEWRVKTDPVNQVSFLTIGDDKIVVDRIVKYENIDQDFKELCTYLGIKNSTLPHVNATKRKHYREYYNKHTIKMMEDAYGPDLDSLNYIY